jgi:clan AA aspartic protease (TIGR02281 family)
MNTLLKSIAVATLSATVLTPIAADALELTCGAPVIHIGQQSKDAHDTVIGIDVYYSNGEWQVRHLMGNSSEVNRINQYLMRDTSNRSTPQWRGDSYKYSGIVWMVGEIKRDRGTGEPLYVEWIYNRGRLVMNATAYCRERVVARRPEPVPQPAPPPPPAAPQPQIIVVPQQQPIIMPQQPPVIVQQPLPSPPPPPVIEPKPEPKPVAKRSSIPLNVQNESMMLNVGLGNQTVTMILDTGATSSVVTEAVANILVRNGHARWTGEEQFTMADGSVRTAQTILISEVRIGSHVVRNMRAAVTSNRTDMLLGFSVLKAIGPFTIDTRTNELIFETPL